jgi:phosphatidylinositol alpha-1,6-mannosyltransferase
MRVLFVSHSFAPEHAPLDNVGGMQRVAMELYEQLDAHPDITMEQLVLRSSWRMIMVRVIPFLLGMAFRLPGLVKRKKIDVVLFSSVTTALPLLLAGKKLKKRGVVLASIAHGLDVTEPNTLYQRSIRRVLKQLDALLPVSEATGRTCEERGVPKERVHVLPNGFALDRFETQSSSDDSGDDPLPPLPENAFLLVSVGRQVERKGFSWFIEHVMPRLPETIHFWMAGKGPEAERIEATIATHNLKDRVKRLGLVSETQLHELYRRGDLFIMPNVNIPGDMEGFGIVMLEAGSCGTPTIAADTEGIRDVINPGTSGYFCPSEDAEAFMTRIAELAKDDTALAQLSESTKEYVYATFGWPQVSARYVATLKSLHAQGSQPSA